MKKQLRIALIAPLWVRIPPKKYGGIELIIYYLANELTERGHKVTLFASGDSISRAKLVSLRKRPLLDDNIKWTNQAFTLLNISQVYERANEFDLIHAHNDIYDLFFANLVKTPTVLTMHNPLLAKQPDEPRKKVMEYYKKLNYVNISESQKKLSAVKLNFLKTVYNGIDVSQFEFNDTPDDHFVWIARVDKYKGIGNAVTAAEKAKAKLIMAGRLDYTQEAYFASEIKPHLNKKIQFIGEIGGKQKSNFYKSATALLYPIEWNEPFGLVMIEAMACGTPVIAFDHGSVREVVKDGKTGFVVKTIPQMVRAMKKVHTIDRRACRKWVEKKFSIQAMVDGYEEVYEKILRRKKQR